MDAHKISLIQRSFEKVRGSQIQFAEMFYAELFEIDPALRSMFSGDMQVQSKKLLAALNYMIYALLAPEKILGSVERLAEAHSRYGVMPEHYTSFGIALLRTLKKALGSEFTPELCDAWANWFQVLARAMKQASYVSVPAELMELAWWRSLLIDQPRACALPTG